MDEILFDIERRREPNYLLFNCADTSYISHTYKIPPPIKIANKNEFKCNIVRKQRDGDYSLSYRFKLLNLQRVLLRRLLQEVEEKTKKISGHLYAVYDIS